MPKVILLAASTAFLLLGVSCFGGDEPQVSEPQVSAEFATAAETAVEAALLTPDDLPPGWLAEPEDEDEDEDEETDFEFTGECETFDDEDLPGSVASADSDELTGPDDQVLVTSAVVFPSEEMAEAAVTGFERLTEICREQLKDGMVELFRDVFEERGADDAEVTVTVEDLPFEELGSGLGSYRINWSFAFEGRSAHGSMDFIFWRQGRLVGAISYMRTGDDNPREERELAQLVDAKLRFVEATLPS